MEHLAPLTLETAAHYLNDLPGLVNAEVISINPVSLTKLQL